MQAATPRSPSAGRGGPNVGWLRTRPTRGMPKEVLGSISGVIDVLQEVKKALGVS